MKKPVFIKADAHEGCVWLADRRRLYFTSTKDVEHRRVSLYYLDLAHIPALTVDYADEIARVTPSLAVEDVNMANSFCPDAEGRGFYVCEQGKDDTTARIAHYTLPGYGAETVVDDYEGHPFNSPNKVILSNRGHLIFSDPDYGFRQGFRPPPALEPNVYIRSAEGQLTQFRCNLQMPHGLALTPDETAIFITDTSADGAHDQVSLDHRRRAVYRYDFDAATGTISGDPAFCFEVASGVPDGTICTQDHLLTGGGDGIYVADHLGNLQRKITTEFTVVNLCAWGPQESHLFATTDEGVLVFFDWRE